MKYVRANCTINYSANRPVWLKNNTLDWLYDQWNARIRADNMKLLWDKYVTKMNDYTTT
jgi:hypothetical protein